MSEDDPRQARINGKIAASQQRLQRGGEAPFRAPLPDAYPPENYRSLAADYPWLTLAAGAGLGLLAGALLPRRFGGKLGRRALGAVAVAGELGLALTRRAGTAAGETGRAGLRQAASVRSSGLAIAREAVKLAARARK